MSDKWSDLKGQEQSFKFKEWYRPGMGTENVGPFLSSFISMVRPQRILEVGAGFTTPHIIDGVKNNEVLMIDENNFNQEYLKTKYDPKVIIIDNYAIGDPYIESANKFFSKYKFVNIINDKFQGKSKELMNEYGKFDFVWFDCGGPKEYEEFIKEYWDICSEYVIFHFTYCNGQPTESLVSILKNISGPHFRLDIVEPHKKNQGSITILRKAPVPILQKSLNKK